MDPMTIMIKLHLHKHLIYTFSFQKDQAPVVHNDVPCVGRCNMHIATKDISLNFNHECVACITMYNM
jgi:hypothetical protein